jgi:arginase
VQQLSSVLLEMGLGVGLGAAAGPRLEPPSYDPRRDPETYLLNGPALRDYSLGLAGAVGASLDRGYFPVVLGGDCSILVGCAAALKQRGAHGLLFIDGHMDFWRADLEPRGEVASMDLAVVTGHGPDIIANLKGLKPYIALSHAVAFGPRDHLYDPDFIETPFPASLTRLDIDQIHGMGIAEASARALGIVTAPGIDGFWIHLDVDALNDEIMPAVDYRMKDGLSWAELGHLLKAALSTGKALGLDITIYNPNLDPGRQAARGLVSCLLEALGQRLSF